MGRKLVLFGAGSAYTPEVIDEVIRRQEILQIDRITLVDVRPGLDRARTIEQLAARMLRHAGIACRTELQTDRRTALEGADYVISQIRVGGWQARAEDERIGLSMGLIGQETTGCGGFMNAMRTIPEALAIARDMEAVCPQAMLINFTNPSGILTEALLRHSALRVVGLCNIPINVRRDAARLLNVPEQNLLCRFAGLNHLSFLLEARADGRDVYPTLLRALRDHPSGVKNIPKVEGFDRLIDTLGILPSPYLQYYYFEPEMLQKQQSELDATGMTRADHTEAINQQLFALYAQENVQEKPALLAERGGSLYSRAAVDILEASLSQEPREMTVNFLNGGAVEGLPENACVEATCLVGREGITRLPSMRLPPQVAGLVRMVKAYESLTVEAAVTGSRRTALQALLSQPLLHGFTHAEELLRRMETRTHCPIVWREA